MQIPYPYKSCNQDKQRIFGENDSQGREFREFEAINSIPLIFGKIKKIVYIIENTAQKTFCFCNSLFSLPPTSEAAFVLVTHFLGVKTKAFSPDSFLIASNSR